MDLKTLDPFAILIGLVANLFTITASGIAIYIFLKNRKSVKTVFHLLLNYSYQLTLSELKAKMDKINELTANDPEEKKEIINILNDIEGQLHGNKMLCDSCSSIMEKMKLVTNNSSRLTEPKKRSLISELRENLRNLDIERYNETIRR